MKKIGTLWAPQNVHSEQGCKMRRVLAIAIPVLVAACFDESRLRADSEANFDQSFSQMTKDMTAPEKTRLDTALKDIVLIQAGVFGAMLEARAYQIPSGDPGAALGQAFGKALAGRMINAFDVGLANKWNENRAQAVVKNARAIVDGRSAQEILTIAESERKRASEAALATYRGHLTKAKSALDDIRIESETASRNQVEHKALLDRIEITKPRFAVEKPGFLEQPAISFNIANKGTIPIKRIFVHGRLQTPGRAIPWVESDIIYEFPGGLEPKETKDLTLSPNSFSEWGKVPREAVKGAILSLNLTAFEDAAEKRIGETASERDKIDIRQKALQEGIRELEGKINDLEMQLKQGS
jgi:hypothetical protein